MAWEIQWQLGVMSDAAGRRYRIARNSRGKEDKVYVSDTDAPPARMIPVPVEPKKNGKLKGPITTGLGGDNKPVVFIPRRMHVVRLRRNGQQEILQEISPNGSNGLAALINTELYRYDGREWKPLFGFAFDHHVQYHIDEEKS